MKIAICLKTVFDPDSIEFDVRSNGLVHEIRTSEPIGDNLVEEGLRIIEAHGVELVVVSVSPDPGTDILKSTLHGGADRAIRIWDETLSKADTWLVSRVLAQALETITPDLILCGARSCDSGSALMVPALAHHLGLPSATGLLGIEIENNNAIVVHKKLEKGRRETYHLPLPAVLGFEDGFNDPRYVAPYSRTYREGLKKTVETVTPALHSGNNTPLIRNLQFVQPKPRVKSGIDVSSLSMQDRLKMMRGELGREKEERFEGPPEEAARKIFHHLKAVLS